MIDEELLARLDQWHDENQHQRIIQEITALPEELQREYQIQGRLARALNNTGKYKEAIRVLESIREAGAGDDRWWSRMGYAFYQQGDYTAAREYFTRARELNPENRDAGDFLVWMGLRANGSGVENSWKEDPGGKPRVETPQSANGWESRAEDAPGPRKPKESDTAGNGWAQKKPSAPAKPRTGGNGNDWEGRGWEGTALLETSLFGVLRFPVKEGLFETCPISLGMGKSKVVELYIREGLAEPAIWEPIKALLDKVPEMYQKALPELGTGDPEPRAVTLSSAEGGGLECALGFSPEREDNGQRVTVRFNQDLEITGVSHESQEG